MFAECSYCGMADPSAPPTLLPGQLLARGVARHLNDLGFTTLYEFVPKRGLRVDVIGIDPKGEIWIVECKSCRADFMADHKWQGYVEWCDRFFWAVDCDFPVGLLPADSGLIRDDSFDAAVVNMPSEHRLAPARRKALTLRLARAAADRLYRI